MSSHPQSPVSGNSGHNDEWEKAEGIASAIFPQQIEQMKGVLSLILTFLDWLAGSVEVFLRFDFGERYLGVLRIFFTYATMQFFMMMVAAFTGLNNSAVTYMGGRPMPLYSLNRTFLGLFIVLCLAHRYRMAWRSWQGKPYDLFSYSFGVSWIERFIDFPAIFRQIGIPITHMNADWFLYRWGEPLLAYLIASHIYNLDPITGTWLQVSSAALFIKNQMRFYGYYNAVLDQHDAALWSKVIHEATHEDLPKWKTAGITAVKPANVTEFPVQPVYKHAQNIVSQTLKERGVTTPFNSSDDDNK